MTLCTAWIRYNEIGEELIFATDCCLSVGERWTTGVKLFELPRKDCLICFAGRTDRAYPLILNLINLMKFKKDFQDKSKDLTFLVTEITSLFTELLNLITDNIEDIDELKAEATFLFGGWSWKEQKFLIYKIFYDTEQKTVIAENCIRPEITKHAVFIGDNLDECRDEFNKEISGDRAARRLDMEPLKVLVSMSNNPAYSTVSGAPQIAKVYKSGDSEFFGIMWRNESGFPYFLGKRYDYFDKPDIKYYDPENLEILESELPENIPIFESTIIKGEDIIEKCYVDNKLRDNLTTKERRRLLEVIKHNLYIDFLEKSKEVRDNDEDYNDLYEN